MLLKRAGPRLPAPLECCRTAAARKDDFLPKGVLVSDGRRGRKATTSGVPGAPAAAGCDRWQARCSGYLAIFSCV